jgi:hypothetical protein
VTRTHEACRLRDLAFHWTDSEGKEQLVEPSDGDHFVITQEDESLRLEKK